jgi:hypothetical protein
MMLQSMKFTLMHSDSCAAAILVATMKAKIMQEVLILGFLAAH